MYKLFVLAVVAAVAQAGVISPYAGLINAGHPINAGLINAGLPINAYNGLGYAGLHGYAAGLQGYAVNAAPVAHAAPVAVAHAAPAPVAVAHAAPVVAAQQYALPAPRSVEEAPIVEVIPEKVEQHGYVVKY